MDIREFSNKLAEATKNMSPEEKASLMKMFESVSQEIGKEDTKEIADQYIKKMVQLRIFQDENGKTNLSLTDVGGEVLIISQFTLYANCRKGNRPSFFDAGEPQMAEELYKYIIKKTKETIS